MTSKPDAYCAPGRREEAGRELAEWGIEVREVLETEHMAGRLDVIVSSDPWPDRGAAENAL